MTKTLLRDYVHLLIEQMKMKEADITGGSTVPWGSPEHILDLESRIESLNIWRNKQPRGSAARANYARLIDQLRSELRSATRFSQKSALLPLSESRYNRLVLAEEIVTVTRKKGQPSLYDVTFDDQENIVFIDPSDPAKAQKVVASKDAKHQLTSWQRQMLERIKAHGVLSSLISTVGETKIVHFLEDLQDAGMQQNLFAAASSPSSMVDTLNTLLGAPAWKQTLGWGVDSVTGRGEITVHLAFASNPSVPEPDWVSDDGSLKLSIKSITSNSDGVRSGENYPKLKNAIRTFTKALGLEKVDESIYPAALENYLLNMKSGLDPQAFNESFDNCKKALEEVKLHTASEHQADGIMFLLGDNFEYFDVSQSTELPIYAIISDKRVRFFNKDSPRDSLNKVLNISPDELKKTRSTAQEREKEKENQLKQKGVKEPISLLKVLSDPHKAKLLPDIVLDTRDGQIVLFKARGKIYKAYTLKNQVWSPETGIFDQNGHEIKKTASE